MLLSIDKFYIHLGGSLEYKINYYDYVNYMAERKPGRHFVLQCVFL